MLKKISLLVLIGLVWVLPASAQDEQATLERVFAALQNVANQDSYLRASSSQSLQEFSVMQGGVELQAINNEEKEESLRAITRGANPNGFHALIRTVTGDEGTYIIQGELRYVDGVLYGSGQFIEGESFLYNFEEGFVVMDEAYIGDLTTFDSKDFVDEINGVLPADNPLNDIEILRNTVTSVRVEAGELDGVPVEIVVMEIDSTGISRLMASVAGEEEAGLFAALNLEGSESGATFKIYLGAGDLILKTEMSLILNALNVDMSVVDPQMAGFSANINVQMDMVDSISEINALQPIVEAP